MAKPAKSRTSWPKISSAKGPLPKALVLSHGFGHEAAFLVTRTETAYTPMGMYLTIQNE